MKRNYFFAALMLIIVSTFLNTCILQTNVEYQLPDGFTGPVIVVYGNKQPRFWQRKVVYEVDRTGVVFSDYSGIYGNVLFSKNIQVRYANGQEIPIYLSHIEAYYKRYPERRKSGLVASFPSFGSYSFNLSSGEHVDLSTNGVSRMLVDSVKYLDYITPPADLLKEKLRDVSMLEAFKARGYVSEPKK